MRLEAWSWSSLALSALLIFGYELHLWRTGRKNPGATARSAHRVLRGEWVEVLSKQPGSELLAVQALRNSLMSATINASTAALALMGSLSLIVTRGSSNVLQLTLELWLAATLFATYVCSAFAMRYYHHAGFAMSLPVGTSARESRVLLAASYVQRAGILYSWSLRCSLFVAPIVSGLVNPLLTLPVSVMLMFVLALFDRPPTLRAS